MGEYLQERSGRCRKDHPVIKEVRGLGLMGGLELTVEGTPVVKACRERGLLSTVPGHVIRLLPPLIITRQELDRLVQVLDEVMER